ncbi:MAG: GntR family transcriptional regulator [Lautropia sp.]|nr:GntR family transcriptional regulator [Lautropia sp.]
MQHRPIPVSCSAIPSSCVTQGPAIKALSLSEQLVNSIRQDILDGVYPPDSLLRQDALADRHGVSRIPVREALLQLESEGLVTVTPRRGATVTALSRAEVDDVFALRSLLEPRLFRASAPHLDTLALDAASVANERYRAAIHQGQRHQFGVLNAAFHMALYARADLPRTRLVVASLLQTSERYTRIQLSTQAALEQSLIEHDELLRLTCARQFRKAEALLLAHLNHVWQGLSAVLEHSGGERRKR